MSGIRATVIVPCYQAEAVLAPGLDSLIDQDARFPYEVLVVENGSTDRTLDVARAAATRGGGRIRVLHEARPGSYAARNRGIREARGEVLLFTDADCRPARSWVAGLVAALDEPGVVLAGGEVLPEPGQGSLLARYARAATTLSQTHTLRHPHRPFLQTANLGVRREVAEGVGGFDEALFSGGDADFCWRVQSAHPRGRLVFTASAEVHHHHRETLAGLFRQHRRYGESDVLLARRHGTRWARAAAKLGLDAVRLVLAVPVAAALVPWALLRGDPLPALAPLLRAVRVVARRTGQIQAGLRPDRLHRA